LNKNRSNKHGNNNSIISHIYTACEFNKFKLSIKQQSNIF
jgi:hypothetical protein